VQISTPAYALDNSLKKIKKLKREQHRQYKTAMALTTEGHNVNAPDVPAKDLGGGRSGRRPPATSALTSAEKKGRTLRRAPLHF
jgi:hypothetical protein